MKNLNNYLKEGFFGNIGIGKTAMIENWLKEIGIKNYIINNDYTIDVKTGVNLNNKNIIELPEYIQFGTVNGNFNISNNSIITLRGCPTEVKGWFNCVECNKLESLVGAPKKIGGSFYCSYCNKIKSLEGAPQKIYGNFICSTCDNLKSLKGAPENVGCEFNCSCCINLKTLEGAPKEVEGDFDCSFCKKLTSLEGAPKEVGGNFNCIYCGNNFTKLDVGKHSKVKKHIFV